MTTSAWDMASVNRIGLYPPGEQTAENELPERAAAQLLRQEAVRRGLLPRQLEPDAPLLSPADSQAIEAMLEDAVHAPTATEEECRGYYEARKEQFVQGRLVHARHILFAVTSDLDVHALSVRAEQALIELSRGNAPPGRFAELAGELSDCPSGPRGGDLGWFGPEECAEELANELFHQKNPMHGMGLHPRLVHSRHGFHIVEVLGRKQGRRAAFEEVRGRIAVQLSQQARARALHQYMQLLAGRALAEGVALRGADSPVVR
jgi:peptidyl-prolyl cis-trans isomerase C